MFFDLNPVNYVIYEPLNEPAASPGYVFGNLEFFLIGFYE